MSPWTWASHTRTYKHSSLCEKSTLPCIFSCKTQYLSLPKTIPSWVCGAPGADDVLQSGNYDGNLSKTACEHLRVRVGNSWSCCNAGCMNYGWAFFLKCLNELFLLHIIQKFWTHAHLLPMHTTQSFGQTFSDKFMLDLLVNIRVPLMINTSKLGIGQAM